MKELSHLAWYRAWSAPDFCLYPEEKPYITLKGAVSKTHLPEIKSSIHTYGLVLISV